MENGQPQEQIGGKKQSKSLSWVMLLIVGLILNVVGRFLNSIIGEALGTIGGIMFLIGIVDMIASLVKKQKSKKNKSL
ncbi:MAG: hypothetical protein NTY61_00175 [Candidatus Parcubacteria bacterium]|nr:hypothetical protein [Candidatus Parcubacteria bacterium]